MSIVFVKKILEIFSVTIKESARYAFLFILSAALEVTGIGFLMAFIFHMIGDKTNELIIGSVSLSTANLMLGLVFIYLLKTVVYLFIQKKIYEYSFLKQKLLISTLFPLYFNRNFRGKSTSSDMVQGIIFDTGILVNKALVPIFKLSSEIIIASGITLYLVLKYPAFMGLMGFFILMINFLFISRVKKKAISLGADFTAANKEVVRIVDASSRSRKEIVVHRSLEYFENALGIQLDIYRHNAALFSFFSIIFRPLFEVMLVIVIMVVVALTIDGAATVVDALIAFGAAGTRLMPALAAVATLTTQMKFAIPVFDRVNAIFDGLSGHANNHEDDNMLRSRERFSYMTIDNTSYRYAVDSRWIVSDLSFSIKVGQIIGIVGESGTGKSTLMDILLGIREPQVGRVQVHLESGLEVSSLEGIAGFVPQAAVTFQGTVSDNVLVGCDCAKERLREITRLCGLDRIIAELPEGECSLIGAGMIELSGGQQQRIAIARALVHGKGVLILDEPTSALDAESEKEVIDLLVALKRDNAIILVTHDKIPQRICDQVFELKDGALYQR